MATLRIIAELFATETDGIFYLFATINFSHMAIFMFLACVVVCISVSMVTNPPDFSRIKGLAFGTLDTKQKIDTQNSFDKIDVIVSVILVAIIAWILMYFRG